MILKFNEFILETYTGKYNGLRDFIYDNDLQKEFAKKYDIDVKKWDEFVNGELGFDGSKVKITKIEKVDMDDKGYEFITEPINESKTNKLTVYHGTNSKYVDVIKKEGLISKLGYGSGWYMLSTDFDSALYHATPTDESDVYVFEFEIPMKDNDRWAGYPWLWKGEKRSDESTWYAPMKLIPKRFIKKIHTIKYKDWLEQKSKGF